MIRQILIAALFALLPALALAAPGSILFDPPAEGGAPDGYRLYVDGDLVGPIRSGHEMEFPGDGTVVIGVEAFNAEGATLVEQQVEITPTAPGPVQNLRIEVDCADACQVTITPI